jgi:(p)ppGpp synthase/HD superfamily hydrolase
LVHGQRVSGVDHGYAQTNLQLYRQLLAARADDGDLALMRDAYETVVPLFARSYRANGKPFVAHLVGCASILHAHGSPVAVAAAGLTHAVYSAGEFRPGTSAAQKRAALAGAVGGEVEDLVQRYTELDWTHETIEGLCERPPIDASPDRPIVLMALANDLEECLDGGMALTERADIQRRWDRIALAARLAGVMGCERMAGELAEAVAGRTEVAPEALRRGVRGTIRVRVPTERPGVQLRALVRGLRRRAR